MNSKSRRIRSLLLILYLNRQRSCRRKRVWSYQWLLNRKQEYAGNLNLMDELEKEHPEEFINFVRMNPVQFNYLTTLVTPLLRRKDTNWRSAIPVRMRLAITLRFLATGQYIKKTCINIFKINYLNNYYFTIL